MMKHNSTKKLLSFILCIVLTAAIALLTTGGNDTSAKPTSESADPAADAQILGQGADRFRCGRVATAGQERCS